MPVNLTECADSMIEALYTVLSHVGHTVGMDLALGPPPTINHIITLSSRLIRSSHRLFYRSDILLITSLLLLLLIFSSSWCRLQVGTGRRWLYSVVLTVFGQEAGPDDSKLLSAYQKSASWDSRKGNVGVYAIQGRRQHMEDRYNVVNNFEDTGTSIYGIFDGHGGEFAADFTEKALFRNIMIRLLNIELKKTLNLTYNLTNHFKVGDKGEGEMRQKGNDKVMGKVEEDVEENDDEEEFEEAVEAMEDDEINDEKEDVDVEEDGEKDEERKEDKELEDESVTLGDILTEEILSVDRQLLDLARATNVISGTTALVAMLNGKKLTVANVGDSRGVICDDQGRTIPLSFDHKPHQEKERKRIKDAGGFISFNGVWRVAGVLATSRALGDFPLKERKFVIADPDILTFDLDVVRPQFMILATDGLWDTFSNEEAVAYIKDRLHEPHFGAKSITLQAYYRGSLDNVTVMVVNFKHKDEKKRK